MKKSLLAITLMFCITQANAAERMVLTIFSPLTICVPALKPAVHLKKCEQ